MTTIIDHIPFPDAATAAAYYGESYDLDTYADMFPAGFSEVVSWLQYQHPDLTDDDITALANAVEEHATRPDQDIPDSLTLRRLVRGQPIYAPVRPAWEDPSDGLASLPPIPSAPTSMFVRLARKFAMR